MIAFNSDFAAGRIAVAKAGGIPALVSLVKTGTEKQSVDATAALQNLMSDTDWVGEGKNPCLLSCAAL